MLKGVKCPGLMTAGKNQLNLYVYQCITVIIHRLFVSLIKNWKTILGLHNKKDRSQYTDT
jgi:hypothetical protein